MDDYIKNVKAIYFFLYVWKIEGGATIHSVYNLSNWILLLMKEVQPSCDDK
jgi:hypothetical protein